MKIMNGTNSHDLYSSPFYMHLHPRNGLHYDAEADPNLCFTKVIGSSVYNGIKASNQSILSPNFLDFGVTNSLSEIGPSSGDLEPGQFEFCGPVPGDSGVVAPLNPHTNTHDKIQFPATHQQDLIVSDSNQPSFSIVRDPKSLVRLAQNREASRKSRLKKKTYVQQLEESKQNLIEVERKLKRAREQGNLVRSSGALGGVAFDAEYRRWADKHQRLINDLRWALNSRLSDAELHLVVEDVMSNYHDLFQMKRSAAKLDIFHILSGSWKTPGEMFFMWLGGFRSSELLKVLGSQMEPLTEQQMAEMCKLQHSCQQAEDALSQGIEALQQAIVETLSHGSLASCNGGNVVDYMGQMAIAMTKIATFDNFLHQADLLRLQTLQQLQRILSVRQTARALLAINAYKSRLLALTSLWLARPKD